MRLRLALIATFLTVGSVGPVSAAETCDELRTEIEALGNAAAADVLSSAFDTALQVGDCSDEFINAVGRRAAAATVRDVSRSIDDGIEPAKLISRLEDSLVRYRLWQTLAMLGDIAYDAGDYGAASLRYQETLEAIDDEELTATAPDAELIERVFRQAEETRLVASEYVSLPVFRDGKPRALSDPDIRGFEAHSAAWPITFLSGSTELTDKAIAAIEDLYLQMSYEDFPPITLLGYSDTRGSRSANQRLSVRRAQIVADYLTSKGYDGEITIDGRGENEPYEPLDPSHYSEDELLLMSRRVDLVR
jgi:outer membrane protein OmpA-like peptidoglycan-associated protein